MIDLICIIEKDIYFYKYKKYNIIYIIKEMESRENDFDNFILVNL